MANGESFPKNASTVYQLIILQNNPYKSDAKYHEFKCILMITYSHSEFCLTFKEQLYKMQGVSTLLKKIEIIVPHI